MASDLRIIAAVLNIITDLERMGDHAEGIAKIAIMIGDEPPLKPLVDVPRMEELSRSMLAAAWTLSWLAMPTRLKPLGQKMT